MQMVTRSTYTLEFVNNIGGIYVSKRSHIIEAYFESTFIQTMSIWKGIMTTTV